MKSVISCVVLLLMAVWVTSYVQKDEARRSSVIQPTLKTKDAYSKIEAEDWDCNFGTNVCNTTDDTPDEKCLCGVDIGEYVAYYLVDFTSERQPVGMAMRVSNAYSADETGIIDVYAKNMYSTPVTRFYVPFTGNWQSYQTLNNSVSKSMYWTQDIILVFSSSRSDTATDMKYSVANVDWFVFY